MPINKATHKIVLETDTNVTGDGIQTNDTVGLGFIPLQIDYASGVTGNVTIQGRVGDGMDWRNIGTVHTTSGIFEVTALAQYRAITDTVSGGVSSPKIRVAIQERYR